LSPVTRTADTAAVKFVKDTNCYQVDHHSKLSYMLPELVQL